MFARLIDYDVRPATGEEAHHYASYACAVHCECKDHYYRCAATGCKHIRLWLALYDSASDALRGDSEQARWK